MTNEKIKQKTEYLIEKYRSEENQKLQTIVRNHSLNQKSIDHLEEISREEEPRIFGENIQDQVYCKLIKLREQIHKRYQRESSQRSNLALDKIQEILEKFENRTITYNEYFFLKYLEYPEPAIMHSKHSIYQGNSCFYYQDKEKPDRDFECNDRGVKKIITTELHRKIKDKNRAIRFYLEI